LKGAAAARASKADTVEKVTEVLVKGGIAVAGAGAAAAVAKGVAEQVAETVKGDDE